MENMHFHRNYMQVVGLCLMKTACELIINTLSRLGLVPVQEASIVVAISSEHRKESLEAVQHAIDALKGSVPIWKKEVYDEGDSSGINNNGNLEAAAAWKANKECSWKSDNLGQKQE
jgi:molybdopterin synthase catalytic subunit